MIMMWAQYDYMIEIELVAYFCWTKVTKIINTRSKEEWLPQKIVLKQKALTLYLTDWQAFTERVNENMFWEYLRGKLLLINKQKHKSMLDTQVFISSYHKKFHLNNSLAAILHFLCDNFVYDNVSCVAEFLCIS